MPHIVESDAADQMDLSPRPRVEALDPARRQRGGDDDRLLVVPKLPPALAVRDDRNRIERDQVFLVHRSERGSDKDLHRCMNSSHSVATERGFNISPSRTMSSWASSASIDAVARWPFHGGDASTG